MLTTTTLLLCFCCHCFCYCCWWCCCIFDVVSFYFCCCCWWSVSIFVFVFRLCFFRFFPQPCLMSVVETASTTTHGSTSPPVSLTTHTNLQTSPTSTQSQHGSSVKQRKRIFTRSLPGEDSGATEISSDHYLCQWKSVHVVVINKNNQQDGSGRQGHRKRWRAGVTVGVRLWHRHGQTWTQIVSGVGVGVKESRPCNLPEPNTLPTTPHAWGTNATELQNVANTDEEPRWNAEIQQIEEQHGID